MTKRPKIIAVVGPTATGKSKIAIEIAKRFDGEVISADSRQVYRGLDIGTGKVTEEEKQGIPHHLIDVVEPTKTYSVQQFKSNAQKTLRYIVRNGHLPIIAGGTGWYVEALIDGVQLPDVPPNKTLRVQLEQLSAEALFQKLQELDPSRAQTIDPHNKQRLIRAIEIATALGEVPKNISNSPKYDALWIGITVPDEQLRQMIYNRLVRRIEDGMIEEAEQLHQNGLSYARMESLGLEYRYLTRYLQGVLARDDLIETLATKIWQYAKRQKTWFRRNDRIQWFHPSQEEQILTAVANFLT